MTTDPTPAPRSKGKMIGIGAAVLLLGCCGLFAISSMMGGGDTPAPATTADKPAADNPAADVATDAPAAEEPTDAPEEEPTAVALAKVGELVLVGDRSEWTVTGVEDRGQTLESGNQFIDNLTTSGRFILVSATTKNVADDADYIGSPKVVDSQGREFDSKTEAMFIIDDVQKCILEKLNPGLEKACAWVFEIPADASGLKLRLSAGLFGDPVDVDLGQ